LLKGGIGVLGIDSVSILILRGEYGIPIIIIIIKKKRKGPLEGIEFFTNNFYVRLPYDTCIQ
jgi:hypothetical protein